MGDSKTITVQTENGDVVVRKLALGDYAGLLRVLKTLPASFGGFLEDNDAADLQDNAKLFSMLPDIIADSLPEFCEVLACVSDKPKEFYLEGELADAIDVLAAALELNNYKRVVESVKKILAGKQPKNPQLRETK